MPNVPNIVSFPVAADSPQGQYIDTHGTLLEQFGLPAATGRLFAYLLLRDQPASLDAMAADLEISKSSASVGARALVDAGVVRRLPQRGSRRVLYEAVDSFESLVETDIVRRAMLLEKWRQGVALAPSERARQRMEKLVELFDFTLSQSRATLDRWRDR
ncbi:MAG TPA: ArsR family transcriptional regulator [Candidatus Dormibacteraeota bacterium]|nr:ArsR family transcriptional regulator [Candidatus Dormibacteraeota bacterium]